MEQEIDSDILCNWCIMNGPKRLVNEPGGVGNRRLSQNDSNNRIIEFCQCYILTFDPAPKYDSKVIHRKEVTHSNGQ